MASVPLIRHRILLLGIAALILSAVPGAFAQVFFSDFNSGVPAGASLPAGPAGDPNEARVDGGYLKLTDNINSSCGFFYVNSFAGGGAVRSFVATFKASLFGGGTRPADGFSFNLVPAATLAPNPAYIPSELGLAQGLSVTFDSWDSSAPNADGPNLKVKWLGSEIGVANIQPSTRTAAGAITAEDAAKNVRISLHADGKIDVTYGDQVAFAGLQTPYVADAVSAPVWVLTARTGGANDNHWIDDLRIVADTAPVPIIAAVGGEWAYHDSSTGPTGLGPAGTGSGWERNDYDTNSVPGWKTGAQLFGNDGDQIYNTTSQPFFGLGVAGFSTPLDRSNGRVTFYFRKKFSWTGSTVGVSLVSSNWVDDSLAAYINGQELGRIRLPDAPAVLNWDTLGSNPGTEGLVEVRNWGAPGLVEGENTLAVEVHQSSTGSSDVAFAMDLRAKAPVPPTIVDPIQPTNRVVFAARATTLISDSISSPVASFQWYRNGQPIDPAVNPTATAANYVIAVMAESDAGDYFCRISNVVGIVDTRTATIGYLLDVTPPKVVSASPATTMDGVTVLFDELVDFTTATSTFGYEVTPSGGGPLGILAAKLNPGGRSVTVTTDTPLLENTVYTVRVTEVQDLSLNTIVDNGVDNVAQFTSSAIGRGFLNFETFTGLSTSDNSIDNTLVLSPKYPNAPDGRFLSSAFNSRTILPTDALEGYGGRMSGVFVPPVSGNWIFYIRSDDSSRLYLNANGVTAIGKALIQEETGCCGAFSGHASPPQALTGGQAYYIEALYKEGGGGDYVQVAAKLDSDPTNPDALPPIGGHMIGFFGSPVGATASITQNPASASVEEYHGVSFTAAGTASFAGSSNRVSFIWQRSTDGGATFQDAFAQVSTTGQSTYTIPYVTQADSGTQVRVLIQAPGASATSTAATLTVNPDTTPPTAVSVSGNEFMNQIKIVYSELMDKTSTEETFSYTVNGGAIVLESGALQADGKTVVLTLNASSLLAPDTEYSIRIDGANNLSQVGIAPVTLTFRSFSFSRGFLHFFVYDGLPTGDNNIQTTLVDNPKFPNNPDVRFFMPSFETRTIFPTDSREGYGGKIAGLFIPPASGNWIFYIVSDDSSRLFLNPLGSDPNGKVMIQEETGCCGTFEGHTSPPQALTAGTPYYLEAIYKEGTGGDYCRVAAKLESDLTPPNSLTAIPGSRLGLFADPTDANINITQQPGDITYVIDATGGVTPPLYSQNFNSGDGGFVATTPSPLFTGGFAYDAASGSWQVNASDAEISTPYTSRLRSPLLTVTKSGRGKLTMAHRWSVETPGDHWDGVKAFISVNGGAFVAIPGSAFTQGGYNGSVRSGSASLLTGLEAWTENSPGHANGDFVTSIADLGNLNAGDTVQVELLYAGDTNTKGTLLPSWQIDSFVVDQGIGGAAGTLVDQNFNAGDGGYTATTPNAGFTGGFAYDAASGSWQVNASDAELGAPYTSSLKSPAYTATKTGRARITLVHRWSVEPDYWDGTQLRISINGGTSTTVPASAFSQGGYNGAVRAGNSAINGQQGWVLDSAGHASGAFVTSVADLGFINAGDTVQIELLYAGDTNTKGPLLPSWQIDSVKIEEGIQASSLRVVANASRPGTPNQTIFYQWQKNTGSGWVDIAGANGVELVLSPLLSDNGTRYRVELNIPGKQTLSREATLTVVQPNTPPQFTCGPGQTIPEDSGAQSLPGWATDIQAHSIPRNITAFASAFNSLPAGTRLLDNAGDGVTPRVEDGVLKLSNAENLGVGGFGGWAIGPFTAQTFESIQASWQSLVGGGGNGGADGYSFNIGDSLADNFQAEEGTGDDLTVTVDTFDNGTGADVGVDIKWRGARIAYGNMPKDDDGSGLYVRKNTFVPVTFSVSPTGVASLNYDGVAISGQIPDYAGVRVNQVNFGAREGGANDRHWIDDLDLKGFPYDASSVEAGQTVQFLVSNDNPSLFVAQPSVSPDGRLTYTPAPNACGSARVTVVAKDNGGTAFGGQDTSSPCIFTINIQSVNDAPIAVGQNLTGGCSPLAIVLGGMDPDIGSACGANALVFTVASGPSHGSLSGTAPNLTYSANNGYSGPDSFTFRVSDGVASSVGIISITVPSCNTPPTAKITAHGLIDFTPDILNGVLISGNGSNACLTLDGLLSTDLETPNQLTYDWTLVPSPVPFASGVLVGTCLEIGTHTIMLTVTDPSHATGTDSITIDVLSAAEAIEEIITEINESTIARGNKRPFIASLKAAAASTDRGNEQSAQNQLKAFQNKVRAQVAKDNPAEAARWTRLAQAIIDALEAAVTPPAQP